MNADEPNALFESMGARYRFGSGWTRCQEKYLDGAFLFSEECIFLSLVAVGVPAGPTRFVLDVVAAVNTIQSCGMPHPGF